MTTKDRIDKLSRNIQALDLDEEDPRLIRLKTYLNSRIFDILQNGIKYAELDIRKSYVLYLIDDIAERLYKESD